MHPAALVGAGFLAGTLGVKILKSEPVRKAAVKSLVCGMQAKESAETLVDEAKAEFDDILAEASYEVSNKEDKVAEESEPAEESAEEEA